MGHGAGGEKTCEETDPGQTGEGVSGVRGKRDSCAEGWDAGVAPLMRVQN